MPTLFVNYYAAADGAEATHCAVTADELGDRLGLSDVQRSNLRHDCERHGRHWITADTFVTVWNSGL